MVCFSFILVKPQLSENVGSCARALANFGFSDFRIVSNNKDMVKNDAAIALSCRGRDLLESAKFFSDVPSAIADLQYVYAVSARNRGITTSSCNLRDDFKILPKTGFLFGCENSGLSNEDVSFSNSLIKIDTDPVCGSMNLSHAVCVVAYESYHRFIENRKTEIIPERDIADRQKISLLFKRMEHALEVSGFFQGQNGEHCIMNLRSFILRGEPSNQEINTLSGIIKSFLRASKVDR